MAAILNGDIIIKIEFGKSVECRMEHLAPLAPIALLNGANETSIGANGDSVSGANGDHNPHSLPW